jgi:hypothetical protein
MVAGAHNWKKGKGREHETTTHLIKIPVFTHAGPVTESSMLILRQGREAWSFDLYSQMTRFGEPFRGSEIVPKVTKGPKNRTEAFCGALRSSVSCSSHSPADRPEMKCSIVISSIASTLGSLSVYERGLIESAKLLESTIKHRFWPIGANGMVKKTYRLPMHVKYCTITCMCPCHATYHQECIIEKEGRGREREMTTHLVKIPVFTHTSRVTKFSMLVLRRRQRSLEFRFVRPDDKALIAFPWIWDRSEGYRRSKEQNWSFCGALRVEHYPVN